MTNGKIIMDKDDYHKILDFIDVLLNYDDDVTEIVEIKDLLEKAEPHEEDN